MTTKKEVKLRLRRLRFALRLGTIRARIMDTNYQVLLEAVLAV